MSVEKINVTCDSVGDVSACPPDGSPGTGPSVSGEPLFEAAAARARDMRLVLSGAVSAKDMREANGAFGIGVARRGQIDWKQAIHAI